MLIKAILIRKMLIKSVLLMGISFSVSTSASPLDGQNLITGQNLADTCAGCHGTDGNSHGPATPSIAGMSAEYIKESMLDFKDPQGRSATIMRRIANGFSETEINLMADYFAQQNRISRRQKFDAQSAAKGKKIHNKYCEKCHEDGGSSADDDAGFLSGQQMDYLKFTLQDFRVSHREMTKKMKKKVNKLEKDRGETGFIDLINFYGSQSSAGKSQSQQ